MTDKQKELVKEIRDEFKALPFKKRLDIMGDGTLGIIDEFLRQYPERQSEVDELLKKEDQWVDEACNAEMNLYIAYMLDKENEVTEEECKAAGSTLEEYREWIKYEGQ